MARYFFRSSILWRDLLFVVCGLLALVPVSVILSDDTARWGVVKHIGYRLATNPIENLSRNWPPMLTGINTSVRSRFPELHIRISEKKLSALLDKMPGSMKMWQKGSLTGLGYSGKIKLRLAGDSNPTNFLGEHKSFRIKTPKHEEILGSRRFILKPSIGGSAERQALTYLMAESLGVLAPLSIPVLLHVNGKSKGTYIFREVLNERFLRNRNLLPGEIYKGDRSGKLTSAESYIYPLGLFNQTRNWKKLSRINRLSENDFSVLERALVELWEDGNGEGNRAKGFASRWDFQSWARYAVLETLAGHTRQDLVHNQRLLYDDQLGRFFPVIWDYETRLTDRSGKQSLIFNTTNPIVFNLLQLPEFQKIYIETLLTVYLRLQEDECALPYLCGTLGEKGRTKQSWEMLTEVGDPLRSREVLNSYLGALLGSELWRNVLEIWTLEFKHTLQKEQNRPTSVLSSQDCIVVNTARRDLIDKVEVRNAGQAIWSDIPIFPIGKQSSGLGVPGCEDGPLPDCLLMIKKDSERKEYATTVYGQGNIDAVRVSFGLGDQIQVDSWVESPNVACQIARQEARFRELSAELSIGPGEVKINKTRVINVPTKIHPGTTILLSDGASLIFRNRVEMVGTAQRPVSFLPDINSADSSWGVVAIVGPNTADSVLRNVQISGGGVSRIEDIEFLGMLSIHNSRNFLLEQVELFDNKDGDDALHLVYVKDAVIRDIRIHQVLADAIDVDIGESLIFDRIQIENAGNDCLDLMTSMVLVKESLFSRCGDKAISVGERSTVLITESKIEQSLSGVVAKDESIAMLVDVEFEKNSKDLTETRKNLAYRNKGQVFMKEVGTSKWSTLAEDSDNVSRSMATALPVVDSSTGHLSDSKIKNKLSRLGATLGYVGVFSPEL